MEEDIDIIGNNEGDTNTDTITGGSHFSNLQLSFTNHEKDGSLHALQTAYSEVKKRLQEQVNKNAVLQTSIREIEMQRISGGRPNSGVFGAAGPPSEPEQDLQAQYRAEFGFAQSLERQVIRAKSTISKLESDNKLLMKKLTQQEEELKQCKAREFETRKENERLQVQLNNNQGQTQERSVLLAEIKKKKRWGDSESARGDSESARAVKGPRDRNTLPEFHHSRRGGENYRSGGEIQCYNKKPKGTSQGPRANVRQAEGRN